MRNSTLKLILDYPWTWWVTLVDTRPRCSFNESGGICAQYSDGLWGIIQLRANLWRFRAPWNNKKGVFKHNLSNIKALCQLCMTQKPKFKVLVAFVVIRCERIGRTNGQHSLYSFVTTKTAITTPVQIVRHQSARESRVSLFTLGFSWYQVELTEKMCLYFNFLTKWSVIISNHLHSYSVKAVALCER